MLRSRKSVPLATLTFACAVTLFGQVQTQDVGSFLAGLLGAAEVPKNESLSEQNQIPCPGECVHAFTSILCSKVIEQFNCGASYLRCCVNSDFNFGTVVETSAPLPEESLTETTSESSEYDLYLLTTESNNGVTVKNDGTTKTDQNTSLKPSLSQASSSPKSTVTPPSTTTNKPIPCPGICVENIFVRYCGSTIPYGICDAGATCCASSQDDDEPQEISTTTVPSNAVTPPKITEKGSTHRYPPTNAQTTPATLPGPPCPGSCVAPLFSLLCDAVNDDFYCANDGRCCISNEEFTTAPTTTITTYPQTPFICPGACIPIFLRGMCNRPSEIITQADCEPDFVCCFQPDVKDHMHIEPPQIPLLRPGANHPNYRPVQAAPQGGIPPIRQPPIPHPYPQRPHIPIQSNPYPSNINTNVYNQPNNNQVYVGRPGYPVAPQIQPGQGHLQEAPSIIKLTHPQSVNYPGQPYQHQSFAQAKPNTSLELQPIRLTVLAPHNPPISSVEDLENERRRPDIILPHSQYPHHTPDGVQLTAINPNPHHTLHASAEKPSDHQTQKNQQNTINRFVSTSIGFTPDTLRPITLNKPIKPPTMEKFHPPASQEFSQPHFSRNASTVVVVHMNKPKDHSGVVHDLSVIKDPQPTQTVPIHDSFRPLPNQVHQVTFKPTRPSDKKPITPVSVFTPPEATPIPAPQNTGDFHSKVNASQVDGAIVEQKKNRPACPGSCIQSFLRFTCFGNSAIYDGFACAEEGTMCCTSVEHIEKFEEHLKTGKPLVLVKPESDLKDGENSPDTGRRPGMYVCGIKGNQRRKTARIVGGKTSAPGEWCWQVALINTKNQYLCGGALIGSRWVLTAAHCITGLVRNGDPIYVRVGDFDLSSPVGSPGAQTQKASTTYIHHNHHGQTLDNDVALLRLENPVKLGDSVCLVCLPARGAESTPGKRCTVTGYGYMSESGPIALKIRQAELPIVEEQLCTEQINRVTEKRFILPAGSFCAGGESGNDACQGDGGGPLTCENEGYYELTGLVSWGFGCGKQDVPGVYVKVSSYIGWINQIISVNN